MQIIYMQMPVDAGKKRELNKAGYRIVDIAFMPDGYENPIVGDDTQGEPKRRGRKPKDQSE
jgi:hypothetical protein